MPVDRIRQRIVKVWTIQDIGLGKDVIGTAHTSREGKMVDFRPGLGCGHQHSAVNVYPPEGQGGPGGIEPLYKLYCPGDQVFEEILIKPPKDGRHELLTVAHAQFRSKPVLVIMSVQYGRSVSEFVKKTEQ